MKIFDGYNVIGAGKSLGLSLSQDDKEERLVRLLQEYRSRRGITERFLVIFDGDYGRLAEGNRKQTRGGITVEWAIGESADDLIVRRVRGSSNPRGAEVVTSDAEVLREVRSCRARGVRSGEFLDRIKGDTRGGKTAEKPGSPTPGEVQEWLTIFGGDSERE